MADKDSNRSVEDIAREAMEAIKSQERAQKIKEEEELRLEEKAKEEALKQEAKQRLKRKMRELKKEEEKKPKEPEEDTRFMVTWKSDPTNTVFEGEHEEKLSFKIKRGINLFHLYVVNKDIITEKWRIQGHTSTVLDKLKSKADEILKESIKIHKDLEKKGLIELAKKNYLSKTGVIKEGVEIYGRYYAPKDDV